MKITKNNFENEVIKSEQPVLLDFWADWCGPCQMLSPVIEQIADKFDGVIKVGKINVDEENELASAFGISSIPMLALIKNGQVIDSSVGYREAKDIEHMINRNI